MADNAFSVNVVNPLQALMLGEQSYKEGRLGNTRDAAAKAFASGDPAANRNALAALLAAGDVQGAHAIANFGQQDWERGFRTTEAARAQTNADRSFGLQEKQAEEKPQYMKDEAGNIVEIRPYGKGARVITPSGTPAAANPYATPGKPMQEHEAKSALFADRAASAHEILNGHQDINQGAGGFAGGVLSNILPEAAIVASPLTSDARVSTLNAQRSFINALLRRESGAAIASSEFASYAKEYFPQPGDTKEVLDFKRKHRAEVVSGLAREAGQKYQPRFSMDSEGNIAQGPMRAITANVPGAAQPNTQTAPQPPAAKNPPVRVSSAQERDALPSGTSYIAPDGSLRTKQ